MKWLTAALLSVAAVLGGLLLWRGDEAQALHGTSLEAAPLVRPLTMTGSSGAPAVLGGPSAQLRLVFFGFTRCPDVCPLTLGLLARLYRELPPQQRQALQVQMVSVDPAHDTPLVLRAYLNHFGASFQGLTGSPAQSKAAAAAFFILDQAGADGARLLHGDQLVVLDRQGRFRRVYENSALGSGELLSDLPDLIQRY